MTRISCKQWSKRSVPTDRETTQWDCQARSNVPSELKNTRDRIISRYLYYLFDNVGY